MAEIHYLEDMTAKKTERLQIVLAPDDLVQLDEWRRVQPDIPNRSEAVRRLIGMKVSSADWNAMQKEAEKYNASELGAERKHFLIGSAIATAIIAMSESDHPPFSDMTKLFAILTQEYPEDAWLMVKKKLMQAAKAH